MVNNMSCFLDELNKLIDTYDIQSLDICVNKTSYGKYIYDTCKIVHKEEDSKTLIAHNPTQIELEDIFRPSDCEKCPLEDSNDCRKCYEKIKEEN